MAPKAAHKTRTTEKPAAQEKVAETAKSAGAIAVVDQKCQDAAAKGLRLRIPYPRAFCEHYDINPLQWNNLITNIWPAAKTAEGVASAIMYCRERKLDMTKKPGHIVPVWSKALNAETEGFWPGIVDARITATRTGSYAGKDAAVFGEMMTKTFQHVDDRNDSVKATKEVTFPEWCRVDVYRIVQGVRCKFDGPKVCWEEAYATESRFSKIPNEMWGDRRSGQLEKCAEAASLRSAFPEEFGGQHFAEEVHGRVVDTVALPDLNNPVVDGEVTPPSGNGKSEFSRPAADPKPEVTKPAETVKGGDPRPEPPVEGVVEEVKPQAQTPAVDDEPPAIAKEALDKILADAITAFNGISKFGALADAREEVEQELPPDSDHLKKLVVAYDARVLEIKAASKS